MNERIRELAEQAGVTTNLDTGYFEKDPNKWVDYFSEKFAELIVRECVQTLRDNTPVIDEYDSVEDWDRGYIRAMVDCEHHIQEHFGVKE